MGFGEDGRASDGLGPAVGRPRGAEWRALQADGIVWEGQVLLVGDDVDLAARLVVTQRRLAFIRGGAIALEVARSWLRPAPRLLANGRLQLSISAPGASIFSEPETIPLWMRDGQQAVGQLIAMLAGSGARALPPGASVRSRAGVLPPLPALAEPRRPDWASSDRDLALVGDRFSASPRWLDRDEDGEADDASREGAASAPRHHREGRPPTGSALALTSRRQPEHVGPAAAETFQAVAAESPVRRASPPAAVGQDRDWNMEPIKGLLPRGSRKRRGWSLRIGVLVVLFGIAAGLGVLSAGRPSLRGQDEAALAPSSTVLAPTATETTGATQEASASAEQTALAVGVGGANEPTAGVATTVRSAAEDGGAAGSAPDEPPTTAPADVPAADTPATDENAAPAAPASPAPAVEPPGDVAVAATSATEAPAPTATALPRPTTTDTPEPTAAATATATATARPTVARSATTGAEQPDETAGGATETLVRGSLRYTVERAERGATLPAFSLAGSGASEWVAVIVSVRNWAGLPGEVDMDAFELTTAAGEPVAQLDPISDTVGSFAGLGPGFGPGDIVPMPIGADERLALAFMVPPDAGELVLRVGDDVLVLGEE